MDKWMLRIALGLVACVTGIDKFLNVLTNWTDYVHPGLLASLPVAPEVVLGAVGVVELLIGIAILTRWTKLGGYLDAVWLALVAASIVTTGRFFDVAVADLALAAAAFAMARSTPRRVASEAGDEVRGHLAPAGILRLDL
ncbi:MAG TPA: hypothetical protein VMT33_02555 [Candidatus Bathyarchaeia archaeon]|jgi:uncharacterized membrane protein YphA (DoxX/SURF4 family)|nr:hypothetical protein [Candidatus Bathyarchaeia archaeon]